MFGDGTVFDDDEKGNVSDELKNSSNEAQPYMLFLVLVPLVK